MKMNKYRLLIAGFVTVTLVCLTGFEKPGVNAPTEASLKAKEAQVSSKESSVDQKQKKTKNKISVMLGNDDIERQRSLDLSMPFTDSENTWLKTEKSRAVPGEVSNMFATENKKKPRPLDLDGQMLMSQEPEMDKRKSLDGAGIVINLKR